MHCHTTNIPWAICLWQQNGIREQDKIPQGLHDAVIITLYRKDHRRELRQTAPNYSGTLLILLCSLFYSFY